MLSTSTPETVNPVADACEAAGVPCLSTVMPWEAFYFGRGAKPGEPSPFKWTYLFSFGVKEFLNCYVSQWNGPVKTNKKVAVLYPNDADGNAIRAHLGAGLAKAGFTIVDPGGYEDGTTDYSAQIAKFKAEQCEIFNTFPIPPDFATFWRQAAQQGYTKNVKIAQIAKTGLFPSTMEALGLARHNLASACYWHPTSPTSRRSPAWPRRRSPTATRRRRASNGASSLAPPCRCSMPAFAALQGKQQPTDKAEVAKAMSTLKVTPRSGRSISPRGRCRTASARRSSARSG